MLLFFFSLKLFFYASVCPIGKFREDCMESCHCGGSQPCLLITGKCPYPTCSVGYEGVSCNVGALLKLTWGYPERFGSGFFLFFMETRAFSFTA